jgi:hypothetical protein
MTNDSSTDQSQSPDPADAPPAGAEAGHVGPDVATEADADVATAATPDEAPGSATPETAADEADEADEPSAADVVGTEEAPSPQETAPEEATEVVAVPVPEAPAPELDVIDSAPTAVTAPAEAASAPVEAASAPAEAASAPVEAESAPVEAESVPVASSPAPPRPSPAALAGLMRPAPPRPVATTSKGAPATAATTPGRAETPEPAPEAPSDSLRFGRVDDDGTVHVLLADGSEQPVGQWAAGTPTEGLTFFVRKYDDLSVEVDLATRRLTEGKAAPEQAAVVVKRARESLASPSMVGDLASLTERVDAMDVLVAERRTVAAEQRAVAKAAALQAREAIVAEAETLALSTQWKTTGERFKTLLDDWKGAPRADRASEQALWKRFSHARSQFDKHRRQYFARLDSERGEAKQVKEALVAEAEALTTSTDWGATAGAYRDLMASWKASGRASKADEDELWSRFRAAQDAFFAARNAALGQRDAGFAENLAAKEALLVEAEAINVADLRSAKLALRSVQERWEQIGHVPRGDKERIEARLRRVEESLRRDEQDQWRRSNPEAKARAEATVEQFQGSLAKLEKARAAAEAKGDARALADLEGRITTTLSLLDAAQRAAAEFSG